MMEASDEVMTLRDYFAASALPIFMRTVAPPELASVNWTGPEDFDRAAGLAYDMADAMLAARIVAVLGEEAKGKTQ